MKKKKNRIKSTIIQVDVVSCSVQRCSLDTISKQKVCVCTTINQSISKRRVKVVVVLDIDKLPFSLLPL